ncbi:separin [Colius striatus]|uniref:separin n=1 Tax=Colius striatus TaxID=57412 RepID=UPI002B1DA009|nr:separin [Colius striatus]
MEQPKGPVFTPTMEGWEGIEELLAKLRKHLSWEDTPKAPQRSLVCDRVLRLCVEQMAKPGGCPAHASSLVAVAEAACQGYLSAVPQPPPLYLEKILYNLLKNTASWSSGGAWEKVAELLWARLLTYHPGQVPSKDLTAVAYGSFAVLWRAATTLAEPEEEGEEGKGALSVRLRSLRFLLLLEEENEALRPLRPPFLTSQTAQQAAAAAAMYKAQEAQAWAFLSHQLKEHLLVALEKEVKKPPSLQKSFCYLELTLERCRHLCKSGLYTEAQEAVKDAKGFLATTSTSLHSLRDALSLLAAGVELSQALADGQSPVGLPLSRAAAALDGVAEASERFLRVLAESCQFLVFSIMEYSKRSPQQPLGLEDVLGLCSFTEAQGHVLRRLQEKVPPDCAREKLTLKQLLYRSLHLFANVATSSFQSSQELRRFPGLERVTASCRRNVVWMVEVLEGLPETDRGKYLSTAACCTYRLAHVFYDKNLPEEASSICEPFCERLQAADVYTWPELSLERLQQCFGLQVECYHRLGWLERALGCVVRWLTALRGRGGELLAEPLALWVRVKADAVKQGAEELRLRTLKEALEGHNLDTDTLVTLLFAELKAYKSVRGDTGQERYNVLCDLLELCSEASGRLHQRAVGLTELAQVLCYHSHIQLTDCSSLDSVREALRLLDLVPRSAQNSDKLLDDRAQAMLWFYICSLESKLEKNIEREQRAKAQRLQTLTDFEPNDLNYESKQLEDRFLSNTISFNLATESVLCRSLDNAFALWKRLLARPGVPAVRSPEQTVASLNLLAALYKLMAKPLQAMESYLLVRDLCNALGDNLGMASALCQVTKLLFQLECPSYAQLFLEEMESCLQKAPSSDNSYLVLQQSCLLLHSRLCCVNHRIEEGFNLLLKVLQNPLLQKTAKVWYLLRAHVLQLVATYLGLPHSHLSPQLRQQMFLQGWKTPKTALIEAHKLFRSIILLLMGSDVLGSDTTTSTTQFLDYGDNVLLKWQVLADMLACSEHLVAFLSSLEMVCRAKAFCLEAVKLAMKLQATRWCASFLVLKARLELQQSDLELSHFNLQQAQFLLDSDTEFKAIKKQKGQIKILPRKGKLAGRRPQKPIPEPGEEEEHFLEGPALQFVPTASGPKADALTASPELKPEKRKRLSFLTHPSTCSCCLCSDLTLSALCLRWLLSCAQCELAEGRVAVGLGLLRAVLPRCAAVAARFAPLLRDKLCQGGSGSQQLPALELLHDLVATGYVTLALQSFASPEQGEKLQEELEEGLSFLACCRPHLPGLQSSRARLLLIKAMATVCQMAPKLGDALKIISDGSWTCQLPTLPVAEPKVAAVPQPLKMDKPQPQRRKSKAAKPRAKQSQRAKALAVHSTTDAFALDDEVPHIVIRPVPCTPHQTACAPTRAPRTPFTIFSESSPSNDKPQLLRAPRALGKVKSRLKVTFSDDSDVEAPAPGLSPAATRKTSCASKATASKALISKATASKATASQPSSLASGGPSGSARGRRGRSGALQSRAVEQKGRVTRRTCAKPAEQERELLRAIEEEEKVEEGLDISFEVLQVSKEEGGSGRSWQQEHEVPQGEAGEDVLAAQCLSHGDPQNPGETLCSPPAADASSLDTVLKLLRDAFSCISHCPPSVLYSQVCQLLALAMGNQDPLTTAYLLSESVSITTRHQLLSIFHRKIYKEKKSAGDVAEQLRGLSLQEQSSAQRCQRLAQLERLFMFSSTGLGAEEQNSFQTQLQQIPRGVTVCLLTLVSLQPGCPGATLLLTRLEKGSAPVNIRIPQSLLPSVLSDFDAIQKEQRETTNCREKAEWWLRRTQLDRRMQSLIENLENKVLGCWRSALIPTSPELGLAEESGRLHPELRRCGWADPQPDLIKVLLNAAALLTPQEVQALAFGLCPAQPLRAQQLLQEALERCRGCAREGPRGSLLLVLDKHLQKLPWESMRCLKTVPVTRLPSLRFLLSYSLTQKQEGSVLSRGVNPTSTFYVLNPHRNLMGTEERLRAWFESETGWRGVTGAIPSPKQMEAALVEHDLYIYAGHGAGACLLDGHSFSRLECRAVVMLFGCSSAALALRGELEGSGVILKYLMAGCPFILGNLWDVTDQDIDRYTQGLLQGWLRGGPGAPLLPHLSQARQAPRLKHLIGAAPVAYGLPVCLQ